MDEKRMLKIVEQFTRENVVIDDEITITRVPDFKTVFIEQTGEIGRAITMTEYKVDGKVIWAGYSSRSQTVYVSYG